MSEIPETPFDEKCPKCHALPGTPCVERNISHHERDKVYLNKWGKYPESDRWIDYEEAKQKRPDPKPGQVWRFDQKINGLPAGEYVVKCTKNDPHELDQVGGLDGWLQIAYAFANATLIRDVDEKKRTMRCVDCGVIEGEPHLSKCGEPEKSALCYRCGRELTCGETENGVLCQPCWTDGEFMPGDRFQQENTGLVWRIESVDGDSMLIWDEGERRHRNQSVTWVRTSCKRLPSAPAQENPAPNVTVTEEQTKKPEPDRCHWCGWVNPTYPGGFCGPGCKDNQEKYPSSGWRYQMLASTFVPLPPEPVETVTVHGVTMSKAAYIARDVIYRNGCGGANCHEELKNDPCFEPYWRRLEDEDFSKPYPPRAPHDWDPDDAGYLVMG